MDFNLPLFWPSCSKSEVMRGLVLLSLLTVGCGPQSIGDLSRPALVVVIIEPGGFCAATYAIDRDDTIWEESGCGESSGFQRQEAVEFDRADLDARMASVLEFADDADCDAPGPSAYHYRFERTEPGTDEWPRVRLCDPGVPLEALSLAEDMRQLASPIADAGADGGPSDAGRDAGF